MRRKLDAELRAGLTLTRPLAEGELVPAAALGAETGDDTVSVSIAVPSEHVPTGVARGSRVDVWVVADDRSRAGAELVLADVAILDAPVTSDTDDDDTDGPTIAQVSGSEYIVTLALSPEQSERFVFAAEFGHVWLSKDPATVSDDGTRLVTNGNVYAVVAS